MINLFALTTRGLEDICAQEISSVPDLKVTDISYRRVSANYQGSAPTNLFLRTVDDLFVKLDIWDDIPKQRVGLATIQNAAKKLDLWSAVEAICQIRQLPQVPCFSVTASFVGKRNYNTDEIKQSLAQGITSQRGWRYNPDDHSSDLNIRIFIEHESAIVGIRLHKTPLQKRIYKQSHVKGSLKPPVAASMVWMLNPEHNIVMDPFCGAGTILIEAAHLGRRVVGGDNNILRLLTAAENTSQAGFQSSLNVWNALDLPIADHSIPAVITNIPWGRQIAAQTNISELYRLFLQEVDRVLAPNGRAVILTNLPGLIEPLNLSIHNQIEISLFGQTPTIIILGRP